MGLSWWKWLGLCASIAGGLGLIPGWETKILHATPGMAKNKQKLPRNIVAHNVRLKGTERRALPTLHKVAETPAFLFSLFKPCIFILICMGQTCL